MSVTDCVIGCLGPAMSVCIVEVPLCVHGGSENGDQLVPRQDFPGGYYSRAAPVQFELGIVGLYEFFLTPAPILDYPVDALNRDNYTD
jgi:hypothetical protein